MALSWGSRDDGQAVKPRRLSCVGCGKVAPGDAREWRAYVTDDCVAVVFCPMCAELAGAGTDDG
jgi:hypothetical protein